MRSRRTRSQDRSPCTPERRARRLARAYPGAWRARYGEEFIALLADDIAERPRSPRRTANVLRCGLTERLAATGAIGEGAAPAAIANAAAGTVALSAIPTAVLGIAVWSQLTVGWRWADPSSPAIHAGMALMCMALAGLVLASIIAAIPLAAALVGSVRDGRGRRIAPPLALLAIGAAGW